jgi:hypothetical protein
MPKTDVEEERFTPYPYDSGRDKHLDNSISKNSFVSNYLDGQSHPDAAKRFNPMLRDSKND